MEEPADAEQPDPSLPHLQQQLPSGARDEYNHVAQIRRQHRLNLVTAMRHAMLTSDYCAATGAVAALLTCMPENLHMSNTSTQSGDDYQVLVEVLWNMLELLRQQMAAPEQVRRAIRKMAALLIQEPQLRQAAQLELAVAYWNKAHPEDVKQAIDLLHHEARRSDTTTPAFSHHTAVLAAYIKYSDWLDQLTGRSRSQVPTSNSSSSSTGQQQQEELLGPLQVPLQARPNLVASQSSSSSQGGDLEGVIQLLQKALAVYPAASLPLLLLCHSLVISGKVAEAIQAAQAAVIASDRSPETLSLLTLLQQPAAVAAAAAGAGSAAAGSAAVASSQGPAVDDDAAAAAAAAVHEHVNTCVEILLLDPWALGAVQGLIHCASHCRQCSTQAIQGLLMHLDTAAITADESYTGHAAAAEAATHLQLPWTILACLLVQLAAGAAVDAANILRQAAATTAAGTTADTAAADAAAYGSGALVDTSNSSGTSAAASISSLNAWVSLQDVFNDRQMWWPTSGIADVEELQALSQPLPQLQQSHDDIWSQQHQHSSMQMSQQPPLQQLGQQHHNNPSQGEFDLDELLGLIADDDNAGDGAATSSGDSNAGNDAPEAMDPKYEGLSEDLQPGTVAEEAGADCPGSNLRADQQLICCKAIVLGFVLGPDNHHSQAALAAMSAVVADGTAGPAVAASNSDDMPSQSGGTEVGGGADAQNGTQPADAAGNGADTDMTVAAARTALIDALNLSRYLRDWQALQEQQQQLLLLQRQRQQQAPTRLFGTPSQAFGALVDMPVRWWHTFPHRRRRQRQQQQQTAAMEEG